MHLVTQARLDHANYAVTSELAPLWHFFSIEGILS